METEAINEEWIFCADNADSLYYRLKLSIRAKDPDKKELRQVLGTTSDRISKRIYDILGFLPRKYFFLRGSYAICLIEKQTK